MLEKFCVFCGDKPEAKTKEHVIPKWLISLTGEPNREAGFGYDWQKKTLRKFAFDNLTFPACSDCNDDFSKLESKSKPIVEKILAEGGILAGEWSSILSWFEEIQRRFIQPKQLLALIEVFPACFLQDSIFIPPLTLPAAGPSLWL